MSFKFPQIAGVDFPLECFWILRIPSPFRNRSVLDATRLLLVTFACLRLPLGQNCCLGIVFGSGIHGGLMGLVGL